MKNPARVYAYLQTHREELSIGLLVEKMGMSHQEVLQICRHSGISAARLVERMQLSKYRFIYAERALLNESAYGVF